MSRPVPKFLIEVSLSRSRERARPGAIDILGRFEGEDEPAVLATVGGGRGEFRTPGELLEAASAAASSIADVCRRQYVAAAGLRGTSGFLSIDYDESDPDAATSYRGVVLGLGKGTDDAETLRFGTGDPVADWAGAMQAARRRCESLRQSSSCDHFVHDVAGFKFDENDDLVKDPEDTLESRARERAARGPDDEDDVAAPTA